MKTLQEQIQRIKSIMEQESPESGKCAVTKYYNKMDKEQSKLGKEADKESARLNKIDAAYKKQQDKMAFDIDYDIFDDKRDKEGRKQVRADYDRIKNIPALQGESKYDQLQKFSILYKVLENFRRRPNISYSVRLKDKFKIPDLKQVTIEQLAEYASKMGWDNASLPKI